MNRLVARLSAYALIAALFGASSAAHALPRIDPIPTTALTLAGDAIGDSNMAEELGLLFSTAFDDALPEACELAAGLTDYGMPVASEKFCYNPSSPAFTPDLGVDTMCRTILTPPTGTIVSTAVSRTSAWTLDSSGTARGCVYPSGSAADFKRWAATYKSALTAYRKQSYDDDVTALANCDASAAANPCQVLDKVTGQYVVDPKAFKPLAAPPMPTQAAATAVTIPGVAVMTAAAYAQAFLKLDGSIVARCDDTIPSAPSSVCNPPTSAGPALRISGAGRHMVSLKTDGSVAEWGSINVNGAAGVARAPSIADAVDVAAGDDFAVALLGNGSVTAWGDSSLGQTSVPAGLTGVKAISAGRCHAVALKDDGTLVSWGCNNAGQTVVAGVTGIVAVQALGDVTVVWNAAGTRTVIGSPVNAPTVNPPVGVSVLSAGGGSYSQSGDQCLVSKSEEMTTLAGLPKAISAPTGASTASTPDGAKSWTFTWAAPTNADLHPGYTYEVRYSPANGKPGTWSDWVPATSGVQMPKPQNGILSRFDVRAVSAAASGPKAEVVTQETAICGGAQSSDVQVAAVRSRVDAPQVPALITVVSLTPKTLRVAFAASAANGAVANSYGVKYSLNGSTWTNVPVRGYATTLPGLMGGTTYQIQVTATNAQGTATATTTARTLADAVVTNVATTTVGGRSVTVGWKAAVLPAGSKDKVKDYRVEYSTDGTTWNAFAHKPSTKTSLPVTGLAAATTYQFRVTAIAASGPGSPSAPISATTKTDVPLSPTSLVLTNVTSTSIAATWLAPIDTGGLPITSYVVTVAPAGGVVTVIGTSASISGLKAGKAVSVSVTARNSLGVSPATSQKITVLGPAAPPVVTVQRLTSSVVLTWKAPADTGGTKVTSYNVATVPTGLTVVTVGMKTTISGLTRGQQVTVSIAAVTTYGVGAAAVVNAAAQDVPGAVSSLSYASKDTKHWNLAWAAPANTGGLAIKGYKFSISADEGKTWAAPISATKSPYVLGKSAGASRIVKVWAYNVLGDGATTTLTIAG
jgi:hypothetical protein